MGLDAPNLRANMPSGDIPKYGNDLCALYIGNLASSQGCIDRSIAVYRGKFRIDGVV